MTLESGKRSQPRHHRVGSGAQKATSAKFVLLTPRDSWKGRFEKAAGFPKAILMLCFGVNRVYNSLFYIGVPFPQIAARANCALQAAPFRKSSCAPNGFSRPGRPRSAHNLRYFLGLCAKKASTMRYTSFLRTRRFAEKPEREMMG